MAVDVIAASVIAASVLAADLLAASVLAANLLAANVVVSSASPPEMKSVCKQPGNVEASPTEERTRALGRAKALFHF